MQRRSEEEVRFSSQTKTSFSSRRDSLREIKWRHTLNPNLLCLRNPWLTLKHFGCKQFTHKTGISSIICGTPILFRTQLRTSVLYLLYNNPYFDVWGGGGWWRHLSLEPRVLSFIWNPFASNNIFTINITILDAPIKKMVENPCSTRLLL